MITLIDDLEQSTTSGVVYEDGKPVGVVLTHELGTRMAYVGVRLRDGSTDPTCAVFDRDRWRGVVCAYTGAVAFAAGVTERKAAEIVRKAITAGQVAI